MEYPIDKLKQLKETIMNSRKQLALLAAAFGAGNVLAGVDFTMLKKANDFSVTATVNSSASAAPLIDVCDDVGKIRVFKDIDDFVKVASKAGLINSLSDISMTLSNPAAFEPALFTGDIVKRNRSMVANYVANVAKLVTAESELTAAVALLPAVTPQEIAYKAEKVAQLAALTANKVYLQAEIVRINLLLPPL